MTYTPSYFNSGFEGITADALPAGSTMLVSTFPPFRTGTGKLQGNGEILIMPVADLAVQTCMDFWFYLEAAGNLDLEVGVLDEPFDRYWIILYDGHMRLRHSTVEDYYDNYNELVVNTELVVAETWTRFRMITYSGMVQFAVNNTWGTYSGPFLSAIDLGYVKAGEVMYSAFIDDLSFGNGTPSGIRYCGLLLTADILNEWSLSAGDTVYTTLNNADETPYLYTTSNNRATLAFENFDPEDKTPAFVTIWVLAKSDSGGNSISPIFSTHVEELPNEIELGLATDYISRIALVSPSGEAWTPELLNSTLLNLDSVCTDMVYCYQAVVEVGYVYNEATEPLTNDVVSFDGTDYAVLHQTWKPQTWVRGRSTPLFDDKIDVSFGSILTGYTLTFIVPASLYGTFVTSVTKREPVEFIDPMGVSMYVHCLESIPVASRTNQWDSASNDFLFSVKLVKEVTA